MIPEPRIRLREAIVQGKLGVVRRILKRWPDLLENIDSTNGWSSLHYAAFYGRYLICRHLIQLGHDATAMLKTYDGDTCIHLAITKGDEQTVHLLLQHFLEEGLNLRSSSARRWAPIHIACRSNHSRCLALLLQCGADVTLEDEEGNTGLHVAMEYGAIQCLPILLQCGGATLADEQNQMGIVARQVGNCDETIKKFDQFAAEIRKGVSSGSSTVPIGTPDIAASKTFLGGNNGPLSPELRGRRSIKDLNDYLSAPGAIVDASPRATTVAVDAASVSAASTAASEAVAIGPPTLPRSRESNSNSMGDPESPSIPSTSRLLNVAITKVRRGEDSTAAR
ncbi:Avo2p [Kluyveromyces lactis]|uniref:KLLA0F26004p n=1 Tax=Kluyveromyces lactis (strain ATCC 8585 / CBS 2359 / DSM 70799 / NBRC 1267 / NRRL Y-1140 / WM37) TaxID=284590 RepID=Q6CIK1_KLULA|nr:uncharacterized protein KLLA0_F26004g [Kluyveromyces lactis]CAG98946.1 KLLA0F26004p [Kluyveromyces lactis]|eukprot:XP_456238.1 uncharacterized protein KLLA0_F26004g [Kluyveromyces lactis]